MTGIIVADKPAGWTSHDVVAKLRGVLKVKRVGHGGTLDPMATGVLPVFIGRATRAVEFCENADKEYLAGLRLGITTDTQDITGKTLGTCKPSVTSVQLADILPRFLGASMQTPPMYSAVKVGGKKLYEMARRGIEIDRPAREISISDICLLEELSENNDFLLRVSCSKGTYIRTLCHNIGEALGCGGAMSSLRRIRAGAFTIDKAHTMDEILDAAQSGGIGRLTLPIDYIFVKYPAMTLSEPEARNCRNGKALHLTGSLDGIFRFYDPDNEFLLLGEVKNGIVRVIKRFYS